MAHDIFISHSSKDKFAADAICAALEAGGIRCWVAPRDVRPGLAYPGQIKRAINDCRVFILVFSSNANLSEHVLREVEIAAQPGRHILSFRLEQIAANDDLDYYLRTPHWLDAVTPPLEQHLERLKTAVHALLETKDGGMTVASASPAPRKRLPASFPPIAVKAAGFIGLVGAIWLGMMLAERSRSPGTKGKNAMLSASATGQNHAQSPPHSNGLTANVPPAESRPIGTWQADAFGAGRGEGGLQIRQNAAGQLEIEGSFILDDRRKTFATGQVPRQVLGYKLRGRHGDATISGQFYWNEGSKNTRDAKAVLTFLNPNNFKLATPSSNPRDMSILFTLRTDIHSEKEGAASIVLKRPLPSMSARFVGQYIASPLIAAKAQGALLISQEPTGDCYIEGEVSTTGRFVFFTAKVARQKLNFRPDGESDDISFATIKGDFGWGVARESTQRRNVPMSSEEIEAAGRQPAAEQTPKPDRTTSEAVIKFDGNSLTPLVLLPDEEASFDQQFQLKRKGQ